MSGIEIGQCTPATRMKVVARDKTTSFEGTYAAPKGKEMVLMLIGLVDKGVPTADIDSEVLLGRMGLVRASSKELAPAVIAMIEKAADLIEQMNGALRGADEMGDYEEECKDAQQFVFDLRELAEDGEPAFQQALPEPDEHPTQPIILDDRGTPRFKENKIVRALLDQPGGLDLNKIACMDFSQEDHMQLAQLIGYSTSGYGELSYASEESVANADAIADWLLNNAKEQGDE